MQIKWLRTALRNLDDEATYVAQDNMAVAQTVVKRILEAVAQLADQPGLGRPGRVPNTRELVVLPDGHPNSPACGHLKLLHPECGVTAG